MKNIRVFCLKILFLEVKFSLYLNRRVFVMFRSPLRPLLSFIGGFGSLTDVFHCNVSQRSYVEFPYADRAYICIWSSIRIKCEVSCE